MLGDNTVHDAQPRVTVAAFPSQEQISASRGLCKHFL